MTAIIKAILLSLPELIGIIKATASKIDSGIEGAVIKRSLKKSKDAFSQEDRAKAARMLNEIHSDD